MAETCLVFAGDSQFQLAQAQVPLLAVLNPDVTMAHVGIVTGSTATATGSIGVCAAVTGPGLLENHSEALNGSAIQNMVPANIARWNPSTIIINCGTNNNLDSDPTIKGYIDTFLTTLRGLTSARVLWLEPAVPFGENWTVGPPANFTSVTASKVEDIGAQIATESASYTAVIPVPMYRPCLAWEEANNAPAPGVNTGALTLDGVHFNTTGADFLRDQLLPYFP